MKSSTFKFSQQKEFLKELPGTFIRQLPLFILVFLFFGTTVMQAQADCTHSPENFSSSDPSCPDHPDNIAKIDRPIGDEILYVKVSGDACCGEFLVNPKAGPNCYYDTIAGPSGPDVEFLEVGTVSDLCDLEGLDTCTEADTELLLGCGNGMIGHRITFLGRIDDGTDSYWYYHVENNVDGCTNDISHLAFGIIDESVCCIDELIDVNDEFCNAAQSNTILSAYNDDIGAVEDETVVWYTDSGRTAGNEFTETGELSVDGSPHTFYALATNNTTGCESFAELTITIYDNPAPVAQDLADCEILATGAATFDLGEAVTSSDGGSISFYSTQAAAMAGTPALTGTDAYSSSGGTIWVRSDNDDDGEEGCYGITSFTLTVYDNPDPVAQNLADCEVLATGAATFDLDDAVTDDDDGTISFYATEAAAIAGTPALTGTDEYSSSGGIIWVRSDNDDDGEEGCYGITSFTLTVYDNPDPVAQNLADCEILATGAAIFDLGEAVTDDDEGSISFYATEAAAIAGSPALTGTDEYSSSGGTIWVRSDNDDDGEEGCFGITSFTLTVYDNPDPVAQNLADCEVMNTGAATFDLGEAVTNPDGGSISFHANEAAAIAGTPALTGTDAYSSSGGTIWVRSETDEECYGITSFTLTVNDNPAPVAQNLADCEFMDTGAATFDLDDAVTNANGGSISFHATEAAAIAGTPALTGTDAYSSSGGTIWVRSETGEECYGITSFTLTVYDNPAPVAQNLADCEIMDTGAATFDLGEAVTDDDEGSISFYATEAAAIAGSPALTGTDEYSSSGGTIWVRSDNDDDGEEGCYGITSFTLTVYDNPDPVAHNLADCEVMNTGAATFDLGEAVTNPDGGSISFYANEAAAIAGTPALTGTDAYSSSGGTIWVRSETDEECYGITSFTLAVNDNPAPVAQNLADCEFMDTGAATFDLDDAVTNANGGSISFHATEAAAIAGTPALSGTDAYSSSGGTIWVRSETGEECYGITSFTLTVHDNPEPPAYQTRQADCIGGNGSIAFTGVGDDLYYSLNEGSFIKYTGEISLGVGTYNIRIRYGEDGCISTDFDVDIDRPADTIIDLFTDVIQPDCETLKGTIFITNTALNPQLRFTVTHQGSGMEYYSGVVYPAGGFTDLPVGSYFIQARSLNGCESGNTIAELVEPECIEYTGCTLGYWKNHTDRWCDAYETCTLYGAVFEGAPAELASMSLLEVLNQGGGGIYNLGRQSVAALLNACNEGVDYELPTTAEVIEYVTSNFDNAGAAGEYLDQLNNAGCELGGSRATSASTCDDVAEGGNGNNGNGNNGNGNKGNDQQRSKVTSEVLAFPVPFKENLNLRFETDYVSDVVIEVFDMRGNHLRTYKDKNAGKGSVSHLQVDFRMKSNQMYLVKITTDRETFVERVVSSKR